MVKKILVHGFPHCGTSILKCIIGHCDNVYEVVNETSKIKNVDVERSGDKEFIVCKCPHTYESFFGEEYNDYIKIFIVRDPKFVFSSLNKRYNYKLNKIHSIDSYKKVFEWFKNSECNHIFKIRYETMFDDNYRVLRNIFDTIGLQYTDNIFDNDKYENRVVLNTKIPNVKPENTQHLQYRTYQINQPFLNMNRNNKIDLTKEQVNEIKHINY